MMKQLFFAAVLTGITAAGYAQVAKGTLSLDGSIGCGTTTTTAAVTDVKTINSTFYIQPGIGYFLANKLEVYVFATALGTSNKEAGKTQTGYGFGGGAGIRKYFMLTDKFAFLAGPQFASDQQKDFQGVKTENLDITLNGGFIFFPTKHIGIRAGLGLLGFSMSASEEKNAKDKTKSTSFGLKASGSDFNLGFAFYF